MLQDLRDSPSRQAFHTQGNFQADPARRRPVRPARSPRALPRCSWQFWDEPDDTNRGPQIIVTEPSGTSHYLIDLHTHRLKVRQRSASGPGQAASYVERSRMAARVEAMARFGDDDMDMYGDDDDDSTLPFYTPGHSTRWWQRWRRMLLRSGTHNRSLLPMYHNESSFDSEKLNLLRYDGSQDEKLLDDKFGINHPTGFIGALRSLACCCSKS